MQTVFNIVAAFWATLAEMAPWLVVGFLFAGVLSVFFKAEFVQRHLGRGPLAVVKASVLGVPLPLCSCGVIPVSAGLYRQGASRGATSSFLLSTPQTGVDSVLATYALMGPVFAVVRPAIALVNGVVGGWLIDAADRGPRPPAAALADAKAKHQTDARDPASLPVVAGGSCCAGSTAISTTADVSAPAVGGCCGDGDNAVRPFAVDTEQNGAGDGDDPAGESCCGASGPAAAAGGWTAKLRQVLRYGLRTLPADIAGSLLLGLTVAALLTALLPADVLAPYLGGGLLAMLAAVLVGTPLYICSTGSIPVALGLMAAGASPGAVLAFLIAGPATNAATVSVTWNLLGRATGLLYLLSVAVTAIVSGLLLDAFYPTLASLRVPESALQPHHMGMSWVGHLWAAALLALLLPAVVSRLQRWRSRRPSTTDKPDDQPHACCASAGHEPATP